MRCGLAKPLPPLNATWHQLPVQLATSTVSPAWITPTTPYSVPGPERTLRSERETAGVAAAAPALNSRAAAAPSNLVLVIMGLFL